MFALGIRYLMGWAMAAADGAKKEKAEWPPHPDRVFMALAAAWFETGEDAAEGAALRWLEGLDPPAIAASGAVTRLGYKSNRPVVSYVPVNDTALGRKAPASDDLGKLKDAGLALLPEYRARQPRSFPLAVPERADCFLVWNADAGVYREPLRQLAQKVVSLGHSASLVQMWSEDSEIVPNRYPTSGVASERLRVSGPGRLESLKERCNREAVIGHGDLQARIRLAQGTEKSRLKAELATRYGNTPPVTRRPEASLWQGYAPMLAVTSAAMPGSIFDPRLIVLSLSRKRPSLAATLKLTQAFRGVLLKNFASEHEIPEWLSGHAADGSPSTLAHAALLPLSFVDREHADGHVLGVALALPRNVPTEQAGRVLNRIFWNQETGEPARLKLFDGAWLECEAELELRESPPFNLRSLTWTRSAKRWASVTPVVLDRHFEGADKWERAAESVMDSCERIGLPRPTTVLLHPVSLVEGAPHARDFAPMNRKRDGGRLQHAHAVILFNVPVEGPVLIGTGRFRGYGLCRPIDAWEGGRG